MVAVCLPRRKRLGESLRFLSVRGDVVLVPGAEVRKVTGEPLVEPCALVATRVTVYALAGESPVSAAETATGVVPAPICCGQGIEAPAGGGGATTKRQSVT
jgi:hypothetical protein